MLLRNLNKILFSIIIANLATTPGFSQESKTISLPNGYYVYLGPKPGTAPPVGLFINKDKDVIWQIPDSPNQDSMTPQPRSEGRQQPSQQQGNQDAQWEENNYPVIKWKAHPITTIPGGVAQIETCHDPAGSIKNLRYKIRLFKIAQVPRNVTIQLLDANGFKIKEIYTHGSEFATIPGTAIVEANETDFIPEADYRKLRDYNVRTDNNPYYIPRF